MNKESFSFLQDMIEKESIELLNKISNIIEEKLRNICKDYGIPPEYIILQSYPEDTYSIAIVVSKFKINHEFITDKIGKGDLTCG